MQVHDELVLEVLESELELVKTKLPKIMAGVADGMLWACRWWQKWVWGELGRGVLRCNKSKCTHD